MRREFFIWFFVLFCMMCFDSCNKAFLDSGPDTTREIIFTDRVVGYEAESIFDIVLVQDTVNKVLITCGENLQSFVNVYLKDDTVHLKHNTKQNWSREYNRIKLEVHINSNFFMNIREAVNIRSKGIIKLHSFIILDWGIFSDIDITLDVERCVLVNSPEHFGLIKAQGKSNYTWLWNRGSCKFRTENLINVSCFAQQAGWGDMYVNATNDLSVSLESTGNVYYNGNPKTINIEKQKGGSLIKSD